MFQAPAKPLWFVAIVVTEAGHWLALLSAYVCYAARRENGAWRRASWLAAFAGVLFLTPLLRAFIVSKNLPEELTRRFGPTLPLPYKNTTPRQQPLALWRLFIPLPSPRVRETTQVFARHQDQALSLDLYGPAEKPSQKLPGIIVVHGGSWKSGDRKELLAWNRYLASRGYLVASVDYRRVPQTQFPGQQNDVLAAIAYLKTNSDQLGLDPQRLVLLGRSAGGQIALAAAYARPDPAIRGVIAFYTPSELIWGYYHPSPPLIMNSKKVLSDYLGGTPDTVMSNYQAASPVFQVNTKTPPTLMIHGGRDELVSPRHNDYLAERLEAARRPFYYLRLPWATHGCDAIFSGPSGQLSTYAVERFLAAVFA